MIFEGMQCFFKLFLTADYADLHRLLRREQADATPPGSCKNVGRMVPGVCDPGLCYGYAPHTLKMLHPDGVQQGN